jgi:Ribonuclease G/E
MELLLKEQLELHKRSAERSDWEKIAALQEAVSVLKSRFEGAIDSIREKLGEAVSDEDIKELKREWETALREAINGIREHFATANESQSNALLAQVELMLARDREMAANEAKKTRQQVLYLILGAVLSIFGALFVFWETTARM